MAKSTMKELVEELEKIVTTSSEQEIERQELIAEAKAGEYHDYKNEKYDCGKVEAVRRLEHIGQFTLADRVRQGEFDEIPDEVDKARMRDDLPPDMWPMFGL
jgi:hypothetical protein